ncbi:hypothetical protein P7C73_g6361, partial [Tremellales sp. Uapishka_1]
MVTRTLSPTTLPLFLLSAILLFLPASALTVYTGAPTTTSTASAASGSYTGLAAYDPTVLTPPSPPSPAETAYALSLPSSGAAVADAGLLLSIKQKGNFLGFSIELSVADVVMGKTPTTLKPTFLNYMANIQTRAGAGPIIRVGGNTQEDSSIWVDGTETGTEIEKIQTSTDVTSTPIINYSPELLYTMANITALVGAEWFFGLSFNQTEVDTPTGNVPIAATYAQKILGDSLRGLALGNEPDLYSDHSFRPSGWNITNYLSEFSTTAGLINSQGQLTTQATLVGPSVCCQVVGFEFDDVLDAGWLTSNIDDLAAVTVQHYPNNNCHVTGVFIDAQTIFSDFLNHTSAQYLVSLYLDGSATVQAAGKELVMLEMNTASCGGFAGLSDSFGAAMWMTDYALQMAYGNFSAALMHVGGQNVYYNPFTPPPSNLSSTHGWTTGSVYYSALVVAEVFGQSNVSQIVDLAVDEDNIYHPAYAIYENDAPTRLALFNFINDPTGASDLQVSVSLNGSTLAASTVSVRYFRAPTVSEQYNITWAGQTMGESFASDGRLYGDVETVTITCSNGECVIPVYAPSIAVVFLTDEALTQSTPQPTVTQTYGTTVVGTGSATVNAGVLETSNGQNSPNGELGSTSSGSSSGGERSVQAGLAVVLVAVLGGLALVR